MKEFMRLLMSIILIITGVVSIPLMEYDATFALLVWFVAIGNFVDTFWYLG